MRKFLLFLTLPLLLFACKAKAPSTSPSTKLNRSSQVEIKGNWTITSVTFPGSDYIKVNAFQIADSKCFVGSTWTFISNNNKGNMSLNKSDCEAFSSPIVWSINKDGLFGLKIVAAGVKSKKVTQGFMLKVVNQSKTEFQLIDVINVGGQNKEVVYQFEKN